MPVKHKTIVNSNRDIEEIKLSMGKAVRMHCLECLGFSSQEVRNCTHEVCALWPFRFGKDPGRPKRILTDEQRAELAARLAKARESK